MTTLTASNRNLNAFLGIYDNLVFFYSFSIFIANITIHFNIFRFYCKCFKIVLLFSSYSLVENKFVYSNKLLPFNLKSINPL